MIRTINDIYLDLRTEFRKKGIAGYQIEARDLVAFALDLSDDEFVAKRNQYIFDKDVQKIEELKALRYSGVPLQHITGRWEFYGLPMEVTTDTLIPRPDTETLVEVAVELLKDRSKGRILDLCCGTGCVGLATLKNVSDGITGVLADLSEPALEVARRNVVHNGLSHRTLTYQVDALAEASPLLGKFHMILCNPPYIPTADIMTLDVEVQREPHMALDGGEDGLDFYRAVCRNFAPALNKSGVLAFEVGLGQFEDVMAIMTDAGYANVQFRCDLAGIERVVWGTWEPQA
ncbi:MAG: peptide chain release factor N(5)-glutamine methyltransferase [Clostridia bacterium]|nr:peptide chain release factor N(5)-glutamine methyltransferase [Clostridia bacterium]